MARIYKRDSLGRFAGGGYSGQTSGRGARLMAKGARKGGGAKMTAARPGGTVGKPKGLFALGFYDALAAAGKDQPVPELLALVAKAKSSLALVAKAKPSLPSGPKRTGKKAPNAAQRRYLQARSAAREHDSIKGGEVASRRRANSAAAKVRNVERTRSARVPKAPASSPRSRQAMKAVDRVRRASKNWRPGSKASRTASVASRAMQIYSGKVDPKKKTNARLTRTQDPERLRKRMAKKRDNTKPRRR